MRDRLTSVLAVVCALALGACGGGATPGADDGTPTAGAATPTETPRGAAGEVSQMDFTACETDAFTVGYPADWWTNPGEEAPFCRMFHPQPTEVQAESVHYAAQAYVDSVEFERVTGEEDPDDPGETLSRRETTIDGRDAIVTETRIGEGIAPEGTLRYSYVVDLDGRILVMVTHSVGDTDYERDKAVLDRMAGTLELAT